MAELEQNRTEPATPFKLEEARKRGQVAKSLEFNSMMAVCALLAAFTLWGAATLRRLSDDFISVLGGAGHAVNGGAAIWLPLERAATDLVAVVLPFAGIGIVLAILANLVQTGPIFSFFPLQPKFERLNPVAGFKRIFNKQMLFQAFKSLLKLAFFTAVAYGTLSAFWDDIPALFTADTVSQGAWLADHATTILFRLALALLIVALLDLAFVRWQFANQMKMNRREIREEVKRRDGDPLIRNRIRQLQRENLKQASALKRVGDADVLITNPDHLAVALVYDRARMSAPQVVARGQDLWAQNMKALARRQGVPVHEHRALARQLFRFAQIDQQIPFDTYVDVARIYRLPDVQRRSMARYEVAQ